MTSQEEAERQARLHDLCNEWMGCQRCELSKNRPGSQIIFGSGAAPTDMMLIGSHPTEDDEDEGIPFSGNEGDILLHLLERAEIDPRDVYVTHTVACRPKVVIPATEEEEERVETSEPSKEHFEECKERLFEQIYQVDPRIIILFGEVPVKLLKVRDERGKRPGKITEAVTKLHEFSIPAKMGDFELRYQAMVTLDMGQLIRNPSTASHGPISVVMKALYRAKLYVEWVKYKEGLL